MEEKTIYELELHESIFVNTNPTENRGANTIVTRVPGGWIYKFTVQKTSVNGNDLSLAVSSVFVAWTNELSKEKKKLNFEPPTIEN